MNFFLRFAYIKALYFIAPLMIFLIFYRLKLYKSIIYRYTLVSFFEKYYLDSCVFYKKLFFFLRFLLLSILMFLIAKPQFVDTRSKTNVDGIDIMLVLDVSGSMTLFDDMDDQRSRIEVAIEEAKRFINKRINDSIGLVIFGKEIVTKCPLTLDKKILNDIVNEIKIGEIDHTETYLEKSIATAANRLKNSKAKSKIIILLTDGVPSTQHEITMDEAIDILKKLGIKTYTVGIGGSDGAFQLHPLGFVMRYESKLNKELLQEIASKTGGKFFCAKNPQDMRQIYDTIDQLEKTKYETNIYHRYYDFFIPLIFLVIGIFFVEQFLATYIWFYL